MKSSGKRIEWIDITKSFACLLVALGHLLMSLRKINPYTEVTEFIIWFIYLFHMPLFMCMSGMLYHKKTVINSFTEYKIFIGRKIINLTVPYVTFYSITIGLNMLFSNSVNTPKGLKELLGIFNNPISPYWFLYALLSIFIFVPVLEKLFKNNKHIVMIIFVLLKIVSLFYSPRLYFFKSILTQGIYFYLGAYISQNVKKENKRKDILSVLLFFIISLVLYFFKDSVHTTLLLIIEIMLALVGTFITISVFKQIQNSKILDTFKKYTFQIFLMHTIFAAGIRIVMYKIGIDNFLIHLVIGLLFSIYVPVLVSVISNKIKFTNFFFYPLKTIEEYKKGR